MKRLKGNEVYDDSETAHRRDEVIRRMANTPPQPRINPQARLQRKRKKAVVGRAAGKDRAGREIRPKRRPVG